MNLDFYAHSKRGWVIFPSHKVIVYLKDVYVLSINLKNVFLGIVYLKMFIKKLSVPFWRIMPYWLGLNVYLVVMADVPWVPLGCTTQHTFPACDFYNIEYRIESCQPILSNIVHSLPSAQYTCIHFHVLSRYSYSLYKTRLFVGVLDFLPSFRLKQLNNQQIRSLKLNGLKLMSVPCKS